MIGRSAPAIAALLVCAGCAYVGEPLPPALKLPNRVTDLGAVERGDKIYIQFTMSRFTTEGLAIEDKPEVDLRVGPVDGRFEARAWAESARRIPADAAQSQFQVPVQGFVGRDVVVAVRLLNEHGKDAGWSNFVTLPVTEPVAQPLHVTARATAEGVELRWDGSSAPLFRVFRKSETGTFAAIGDTEVCSYLDRTAIYGKPLAYYVQGLRKTGQIYSESDVSATETITPKDTFAPAIPTDVTAIAGTRTVELSWARNTEADLAGYRVYRAEGDGPFTRIADNVTAPSYSDRAVQPGARYRYVITAFDQSGNESERSPSIEVRLY